MAILKKLIKEKIISEKEERYILTEKEQNDLLDNDVTINIDGRLMQLYTDFIRGKLIEQGNYDPSSTIAWLLDSIDERADRIVETSETNKSILKSLDR